MKLSAVMYAMTFVLVMFFVYSFNLGFFKIEGTWKREMPDGGWVVYQYQKDGELSRSTNSQQKMFPLGRFFLNGDIIYFKDNPEGYTPARFVIKISSCSGRFGRTLFLYDSNNGRAYGCYFKVHG